MRTWWSVEWEFDILALGARALLLFLTGDLHPSSQAGPAVACVVWANTFLAGLSLALNFAMILVLGTFLSLLEMLASFFFFFFASSDLSYGPKGKPKPDPTEGCSWNLPQGYTCPFVAREGLAQEAKRSNEVGTKVMEQIPFWMQICNFQALII